MPPEGAAPGPETPGWSPPGAAYAPVEPYRPIAGLSPWIFWLLLIIAATSAISALVTLGVYGLGEYSTPASYDRFGAGDVALALIGLLESLLVLAAAVLFIIWFYRAYKNLRPLGAPPPRRSAGWTIGAWFVPILNLILPKLMLNEIWRGSEPEPVGGPGTKAPIPPFHHLWWGAWVGAFLVAIGAGVDSAISSIDSALSAEGATVTTASGALSVLASLLDTLAAVLGALVVRRTNERQESRWRRLESARPAAHGATGWTPA
jgi:hypothetical protein